MDPNCPTEAGPRPGCGAIVAMIEKATGKKAFSLGKPSPIMMRAARKQLGLSSEETIMVGDTMDTDILGGVGLGYRTILVMSGGTKLGDLGDYAYSPDMIVDSVADIPENLVFPEIPPPNSTQNGSTSPSETQRTSPVESVAMPS
jgi:NagD protein